MKEQCEREDMEYSEDRIFQDELLHTLTLVFAYTFSGYEQEAICNKGE